MKMKKTSPVKYVILDNIRSAFNVGSIFRTSDAAGDCNIIICGMTATPENPKVLKTSLGAEKSVPWKYYKSTIDAIKDLKDENVPIYAIEINNNSVDYQSITFPNPVALIFGHEKMGVSDEALTESDKVIHIPMRGIKKSLNVATTAGIILYAI